MHFVVVSRHQQTTPLNSDYHQLAMVRHSLAFRARDGARYWLRIRDFCKPHLHSTPRWGEGSRRNVAMTYGMEKLEWFGYLTVQKN